MKNLIILSIVLLCLSCSKDEDTSIIGSGNLTMKINGVAWSGTIITNFVDQNTENAAVQSFSTNTESFAIAIEDFTGVGQYPTAQGASFTVALYTRADKVVFTGGSEMKYKVDNIVGTGSAQKIHGTFSGTMKSSSGEVLTITDGKF